jgi:hypothetical protein
MKSSVKDIDRGWKGILQAARELGADSSVRVGILGDNERGGLHVPGAKLTVAEIALVNEYGTADGRIPSRPAHRMAFDSAQDKIQKLAFQSLVRIVLDRKMTVEQGLGLLGLTLATEIKKTIVDGSGVPPPNAPSVQAAKEGKGAWNKKGKAQAAGMGVRTLVDTGRTINAISWAVTLKNAQKAAQFLSGGSK